MNKYTANRMDCSPEILNGLEKITESLSLIYGTKREILTKDQNGVCIRTSKLKKLAMDGCFKDYESEFVRGLICSCNIPEDGGKTGVILSFNIIKRMLKYDLTIPESLNLADAIETKSKKVVSELSVMNEGILPGGGLLLENIKRPVIKALKSEGYSEDLGTCVMEAFTKPLLILATNAGKEPHEVFERVRGLAPNQFYSLNHNGLERSIDGSTITSDIYQFGLNVESGKIENLMVSGITEMEDYYVNAISFAVNICKSVILVKTVL